MNQRERLVFSFNLFMTNNNQKEGKKEMKNCLSVKTSTTTGNENLFYSTKKMSDKEDYRVQKKRKSNKIKLKQQ